MKSVPCMLQQLCFAIAMIFWFPMGFIIFFSLPRRIEKISFDYLLAFITCTARHFSDTSGLKVYHLYLISNVNSVVSSFLDPFKDIAVPGWVHVKTHFCSVIWNRQQSLFFLLLQTSTHHQGHGLGHWPGGCLLGCSGIDRTGPEINLASISQNQCDNFCFHEKVPTQ